MGKCSRFKQPPLQLALQLMNLEPPAAEILGKQKIAGFLYVSLYRLKGMDISCWPAKVNLVLTLTS